MTRLRFTAVLLAAVIARSGSCDQKSQEAVNEAARALYYQQNWNAYTNEFAKRELDRNLTKPQQEVAMNVFVWVNMILNREIRGSWTF